MLQHGDPLRSGETRPGTRVTWATCVLGSENQNLAVSVVVTGVACPQFADPRTGSMVVCHVSLGTKLRSAGPASRPACQAVASARAGRASVDCFSRRSVETTVPGWSPGALANGLLEGSRGVTGTVVGAERPTSCAPSGAAGKWGKAWQLHPKTTVIEMLEFNLP